MSYKGGKKSTTNHLRFPENYYTPHAIMDAEVMTEKEARAEYSRMRSIAKKRLERFEGTEWTDTDVYKYNQNRYKPLSEIQNFSELTHLLSDVARFLSTEQHINSVSGLEKQRKQALKTLHENGYSFVKKSNFKQFGQFMEEVRARKIGYKKYNTALELFAEAARRKIPPEQLQKDFNYWLENTNELKKQPLIKSDKPHDAAAYKRLITNKKAAATRKQNARKKR